MRTPWNANIALPCMMILLMLASPLMGQNDDRRQRERIGDVLGKPVYRDDIRSGKSVSLPDELHRLFASAVTHKYRKTHKKEVTPTPSEIASAREHFDKKHRERIKEQEPALRARLKAIEEKLSGTELNEEEKEELVVDKRTVQMQLNPPGEFFAVFVLRNWKFQRHLHKKYGGGRILWQQAGLEAFDATHKWLQDQEKSGAFKITDPKLRTVFYKYWTTHDHGPFFIEDKELIRREFLEPEWLETPSRQN